MNDIKSGLTGDAKMIVGTNDTAPRVGSGKIPVLATPVMINLMEEAALDAIESLLPEGKQSLGTRMEISHTAATPTGMTVTARAELVKVDGRTFHFIVSAYDEIEEIGRGHHERVVVTAKTFEERVARKVSRSS